MTIGRRHAFLALGFLFAAAVVAGGRAHAQFPNPGPHHPAPWETTLSPEQLKAAMERLGKGGDDPFQKLLQELLQKNPNFANDPETKKKIDELKANPQLMKQLEELARQKKDGKNPDTDLGKLLESIPPAKGPKHQAGPDDPGGAPKPMPPLPNPGPVPKFQPAPKMGAGPGHNPNVKDFPPVPPARKHGPHEAPETKTNPFGQPDEPTDPRAKSLSAMAALWERNVGPLDETPEVKRALFDLVSGDNGFDFDATDENGHSLWDWMKNGDGDAGKLFDESGGDAGGDWKWPKTDWLDGWGKWFDRPNSSSSHSSSSSSPASSRSSSSSGGGLFSNAGGLGGLSGSTIAVVLLALLIAAAVLASWWFLRGAGTSAVAFAGGPGPWPIDPHAINSRADIVKAFEYLSVLLCGPSAKMWTHGTVADALGELAVDNADAALKLARLYELARYAPLDEPLTRREVIEARHLVCELAGVA